MGRNDLPAFSRGQKSSLFGKRTRDTRFRISEFTAEKLAHLWRSLGYRTESEFLADLIELRVHGLDHVEKLHRDRLRAVSGGGKE